METLYALLIIILAIGCLSVYYEVKDFRKPLGILLFFLGISALVIRITLLKSQTISWFNNSTLLYSILLLCLPGIPFIIYALFKSKFFKGKRKYFIKLLPAYLLFGGLQQLFFLIVFTDAVMFLTHSQIVSFILGFIFFVAFHLNWESFGLQQFFLLLCLFGLINVFIYVYWGNIIPSLVIHGFMGSIIFTAFSHTDQLRQRF